MQKGSEIRQRLGLGCQHTRGSSATRFSRLCALGLFWGVASVRLSVWADGRGLRALIEREKVVEAETANVRAGTLLVKPAKSSTQRIMVLLVPTPLPKTSPASGMRILTLSAREAGTDRQPKARHVWCRLLCRRLAQSRITTGREPPRATVGERDVAEVARQRVSRFCS